MDKNRNASKYSKTKRSRSVLKKNKNVSEKNQEQCKMNYQQYHFSWKEQIRMIAEFVLTSGGFAYWFNRSWIVFAVFLMFYPLYAKRVKKRMICKRQEVLCREFKDSILCVASSLAAGYSIENAFRDAYAQMYMQYGEHSLMTEELRCINSCLSLNIPLEELLYDFANRSGLEDVRSFCEVFVFAKRSGGDFIQIIHITAARISEKNDLLEAIQTEISGKKMEQKLMNLMPLFILVYIDFSFGGYLDGLYHNTLGVMIMTICLAVYIGAYLLSEKIMSIQI